MEVKMTCGKCKHYKEYGGYLPLGVACFKDDNYPDYGKGVKSECDKGEIYTYEDSIY